MESVATQNANLISTNAEKIKKCSKNKKPEKFSKFRGDGLETRKKLEKTLPQVDAKPPKLIPDLYLKPRVLVKQMRESERILYANLQLLARVDVLNRRGGVVDCWALPMNYHTSERLIKKRTDLANQLARENRALYYRLSSTNSRTYATKYLNEEWKNTLDKIKLMGTYPFCLQSMKTIDCGMVDPDFTDIGATQKLWMDLNAEGGIHIGTITIELFDKVCPQTCRLFKVFTKGKKDTGEGYFGTAIFTVVPEMYCTGGDVTKNNGFGGMITGEDDIFQPENFKLKHSIPGVLSMAVVDDKVNGTFNITFRPMPLLDGKNVVFGRIIAGNYSILETLSSMGTPLGISLGGPYISQCGWINKKHKYRPGRPNRIIVSL